MNFPIQLCIWYSSKIWYRLLKVRITVAWVGFAFVFTLRFVCFCFLVSVSFALTLSRALSLLLFPTLGACGTYVWSVEPGTCRLFCSFRQFGLAVYLPLLIRKIFLALNGWKRMIGKAPGPGRLGNSGRIVDTLQAFVQKSVRNRSSVLVQFQSKNIHAPPDSSRKWNPTWTVNQTQSGDDAQEIFWMDSSWNVATKHSPQPLQTNQIQLQVLFKSLISN